MSGAASYTDAEVKKAMGLWKDLVDAGCFAANSNANDWTDASDQVARGDAAMTLMGTWITGYWNGQGLKPGADYDFFEFPAIADGVPNAVVGPVDGLLISANAANPDGAKKLLAWLVSDPAVQAKWAEVQGALSPNDAALRVQMRVEIARLHAEIGATMIYVTHDQVEAMTLADRIVVLNHGVVEQVGAPIDLYDRPANKFVAGFIGQPKMNFLDAMVARRGADAVSLTLPGAAAPVEVALATTSEADSLVTLGVRPNALAVADGPGDLAGRVAVVEHLGSESIVHVAVDGVKDLVTVVAAGRTALRHGDSVALAIDRAAVHLFDAGGAALS